MQFAMQIERRLSIILPSQLTQIFHYTARRFDANAWYVCMPDIKLHSGNTRPSSRSIHDCLGTNDNWYQLQGSGRYDSYERFQQRFGKKYYLNCVEYKQFLKCNRLKQRVKRSHWTWNKQQCHHRPQIEMFYIYMLVQLIMVSATIPWFIRT